MTTQRSHTVTITGDSEISLGDLRWLVAQLAAASDNHKIRVTHYAGDVRESSQSTLSTEVPDVPAKPSGPVYRDRDQTPPTAPNSGWILTNTQHTSSGVHVQPTESQNER